MQRKSTYLRATIITIVRGGFAAHFRFVYLVFMRNNCFQFSQHKFWPSCCFSCERWNSFQTNARFGSDGVLPRNQARTLHLDPLKGASADLDAAGRWCPRRLIFFGPLCFVELLLMFPRKVLAAYFSFVCPLPCLIGRVVLRKYYGPIALRADYGWAEFQRRAAPTRGAAGITRWGSSIC